MSTVAIGSIAAAAIGAGGSALAADSQSDAAKSAAQLQYKEQQDALAFQKQEWETQQQNIAPWLTAGKGALSELSGLLSKPGEGLLTPWTQQFQAPTSLTEQNDPGFKARLTMGSEALENSAAARGGLLSGGTAKDLTNYAQDFASNEYGNVFNRSLQQYQQAYNIFQNNQTNTYNRLAGLSGTGQQAATTLGSEGQAAAGNVANINLTGSGLIGGSLQNAGTATASGYAGAANAFGGAFGNISSMALLQQILSGQGGGSGPGGTPPILPSDSLNGAFGY